MFPVNPEANVPGLSEIKTHYTLTYVIRCRRPRSQPAHTPEPCSPRYRRVLDPSLAELSPRKLGSSWAGRSEPRRKSIRGARSPGVVAPDADPCTSFVLQQGAARRSRPVLGRSLTSEPQARQSRKRVGPRFLPGVGERSQKPLSGARWRAWPICQVADHRASFFLPFLLCSSAFVRPVLTMPPPASEQDGGKQVMWLPVSYFENIRGFG